MHGTLDDTRVQQDREAIASELLNILHSIPIQSIATNGPSLVHKVRFVASTLLDAARKPATAERAERANAYLCTSMLRSCLVVTELFTQGISYLSYPKLSATTCSTIAAMPPLVQKAWLLCEPGAGAVERCPLFSLVLLRRLILFTFCTPACIHCGRFCPRRSSKCYVVNCIEYVFIPTIQTLSEYLTRMLLLKRLVTL
jgi:hypothetical protein